MRVNSAGIAIIKKSEALRLRAYKDPAGVWSIGYGHTGGVKEEETISVVRAEMLFNNDVDEFSKGVLKAIGNIPITENQFSAMVSLAYNIGLGSFAKSTVLRAFKEGNLPVAARAFDLYVKARVGGKKVVLSGLVTRRAAEKILFLSDASPLDPLPEALPEKPLSSSRTIKGGQVAGTGVTLAAITEMIDPIKMQLADLAMYIDIAKWAFLAIALVGIGITIWARVSDRNEGAN